MKSVYISGPYTASDHGGEDKNIAVAAAIAAIYIREGWAVFCPHTMMLPIDRHYNAGGSIAYEDWLTMDLYWLAKCDAIHMLPGWEKSKGARIEYMAAKAMGLELLGEVSGDDGV